MTDLRDALLHAYIEGIKAVPKWSGRFAQQQTALCLATFGTRCHLCGEEGATTADHLIPQVRGGSSDIGNLRPAHHGCNAARGGMPLDRWFRLHPIAGRPLAPSREW